MTFNPAIHKNKLVQILKDIYKDPAVGQFLGFKGGTAAALFYGLDRESVDLDFDLLDTTKEDDIFERVKTIVSTYGTLKDAAKKRFTLFYLLSYTEKLAGHQNVKIDINRRNYGAEYEVKLHFGMPMKVMAQADMAAYKLVAMLERIGKTHRDIWDVHFFLKNNWPVNTEIIEKRTNLQFGVFLETCIVAIEKKTADRSILSGLGELLTEKQKIWAKPNLRADTIFLLKHYMSMLKS